MQDGGPGERLDSQRMLCFLQEESINTLNNVAAKTPVRSLC